MTSTPRFKDTEIGSIPDDWDVFTLSELSRKVLDGTHFTPRYVPQGVPFYSVENITANDFTNTKFITEEEHNFLVKRCKPERGDIMMTRITAGILGDTKIIDWDVNASIYVSLALIKPNGRILPEYLYRYSKSPSFRKSVELRGLVNATPKKINLGEIGKIPVPVPPSQVEQRAIAGALSDVDDLINSLDQLIAKKRAIKQATMQQLLTGKTRLPRFRSKAINTIKTEFGEFPNDWKLEKLGRLLEAAPTYGINAPAVAADDKYPAYLRITDINEDGRYIPNPAVSVVTDEIEKYKLRSGDIVLARTGASVGKSYLYNSSDGLLIYAGFLIKIRANQQFLDPRFLFSYLRTAPYWKWVSQTSMRSGQPGINGQEYASHVVPVPSVDEQREIADLLTDMDSDIDTMALQQRKIRALKQGMMQELLTGKTRLV